jgi:hypothetical protein
MCLQLIAQTTLETPNQFHFHKPLLIKIVTSYIIHANIRPSNP